MSNIQKTGKAIQNYVDNTQPESTFSIFRKTVTHLKNILRSIMRAIKISRKFSLQKRSEKLDLFNLEKKDYWEEMPSAKRLLLAGRKVSVVCFYNGYDM